MSTYVVNGNGYFFEVLDEVPLDPARLIDCQVLDSLVALYEASSAITGVEVDELEGLEMVIRYRYLGANGAPYHLTCLGDRGEVEHIEDTVEYQRGGLEEYLSDYVE